MCPKSPKVVSLSNIQLILSNKIFEGLMSSLNYHKVHRNLFIVKGGIEVTKCLLGQFWT